MALIYSVFPREGRVKAMGYWSMVMAGGPVIGVVAGGPIVEALSWRWIFVIQAPLAMFGVVVALLLLPETERRADRTRFDLVGAVLLSSGVTSLLLGLNRGPVLGWTSPLVLFGFAYAPAALIAFLRWEGKVASPLLRTDYLRRRNFSAPVATQFFSNFAYMGGFIITPLFLATAFGYGATRIGLLSIARPLAFSIAAPLGGYVAARVGERTSGIVGAALVTLSMVGLAQVAPGAGDHWVVLSLALSGIGLGASSPSMAATGRQRGGRGRPRGGGRHPAAHDPGRRGRRHPAHADAPGVDGGGARPGRLLPRRLLARRAPFRCSASSPPPSCAAPARGGGRRGAGVAVGASEERVPVDR
jgi:MFS family permease